MKRTVKNHGNHCGVTSLFEKNNKSRLGKIACNVCENYFLGTPAYVIILGLVGTVITGFDIIRIMNSKSQLKCQSRSRGSDVVPSEVERDLKLMTSILGIEHYTLIMLGAITDYPMLHTPWLLMQLCVILVEIVVFFVRLFLDGLHLRRDEILLAFLAVHNWLQMADISENTLFTDPVVAISQGKRHLLVRDYSMAVTALAQACELLAEKHGDSSDELGEPYLLYGRALLALAREEAGVLGGGVLGSEQQEGEGDIEEEDGTADEEDKEDENEEDDEEQEAKTNGAATEDEKKSLESKVPDTKTDSTAKPENDKSKSPKEEASESQSKGTGSVEESLPDDQGTKITESDNKTESSAADDAKPIPSTEASEAPTQDPTKTSVDSQEKPDSTESNAKVETPASSSGSNAVEKVKQNGEASQSKKDDGENVGKDEDEEDVNNLQLAWEILELAKLVLLKRGPPGWKHLAEAHRLLGEVSMESGNHQGALTDLKACLELLTKVDRLDSRAIAETYYQLGLAYSMANEFDESIDHFTQAYSLLEHHIVELEESQSLKKSADPSYTVDEEIAELKELLPDIEEKITDMKDFKEEACKAMIESIKNKVATIDATNGAGPSKDGASSSADSSIASQTKPASDISHLIRKKRKADEIEKELSSPCKKPTP